MDNAGQIVNSGSDAQVVIPVKRKRGRPPENPLPPEVTEWNADKILRWLGEAKLWRRVLKSKDDTVVLRALIYLTDRRDGKAAQQINVTSQSLIISASDVERARAIATELRSSLNLRLAANGLVDNGPTAMPDSTCPNGHNASEGPGGK